MSALSLQQQHVVERIHGVGMDALSVRDIATGMGVTPSRVYQIHRKAIRVLLYPRNARDPYHFVVRASGPTRRSLPGSD